MVRSSSLDIFESIGFEIVESYGGDDDSFLIYSEAPLWSWAKDERIYFADLGLGLWGSR